MEIQWIHKRVPIVSFAMNKSASMRIRIDPELHREFLDTCKQQDKPAAQVIREFMREYVARTSSERQADLFALERKTS